MKNFLLYTWILLGTVGNGEDSLASTTTTTTDQPTINKTLRTRLNLADSDVAFVTVSKGYEKNGYVRAMRLSNQEVLGEVEVGVLPQAITITPDGKHAVVTNMSNSINIINLVKMTKIKDVTDVRVSDEPNNVVISKDSSKAFVLSRVVSSQPYMHSRSSGIINVINLRTLEKEKGILMEGERPESAALSKDGKHLWVSGGTYISIIETDTRQVIKRINTEKHQMLPGLITRIPGTDLFLVFNQRDAAILIIDASTFKEWKNVSFGLYPSSLAVTEDGKYIIAASNTKNRLSIFLNTLSQGFLNKVDITLGSTPISITFTLEGVPIVLCEDGALYKVNLLKGNATPLTSLTKDKTDHYVNIAMLSSEQIKDQKAQEVMGSKMWQNMLQKKPAPDVTIQHKTWAEYVSDEGDSAIEDYPMSESALNAMSEDLTTGHDVMSDDELVNDGQE